MREDRNPPRSVDQSDGIGGRQSLLFDISRGALCKELVKCLLDRRNVALSDHQASKMGPADDLVPGQAGNLVVRDVQTEVLQPRGYLGIPLMSCAAQCL